MRLRILSIFIIATRVVGLTDALIRGVNLGGWLVTEEWITPSLYDDLPSYYPQDEWHLCNHLGGHDCFKHLHRHWRTFYTQDDFQDIAAAGLNTVRIPIGYWAVDLEDYEPYVQGQFTWLIRAVLWAKEYGLSVLIDLHGVPGSQNAQANSGWGVALEFMNNMTNSERSLKVLRNITEEFSQTNIYGHTVTGIEVLNEPRLAAGNFDRDQLRHFYSDAAQVIWGHDAGTTMNVTIHDAFEGPEAWANYSPTVSDATKPAEYLTVDTHNYYAFAPENKMSNSEIIAAICNMSQLLKQSTDATGLPPTLIGEWSLANSAIPTPSPLDDDPANDQAKRTWMRLFFEAQHAAYTPNAPGQASIGWIFWAWRTEHDIADWSYRKGIQEQYIPANVANASELVYRVLEDGCVDTRKEDPGYVDPSTGWSTNYTAPAHVDSGADMGKMVSIVGLALLAVGAMVI